MHRPHGEFETHARRVPLSESASDLRYLSQNSRPSLPFGCESACAGPHGGVPIWDDIPTFLGSHNRRTKWGRPAPTLLPHMRPRVRTSSLRLDPDQPVLDDFRPFQRICTLWILPVPVMGSSSRPRLARDPVVRQRAGGNSVYAPLGLSPWTSRTARSGDPTRPGQPRAQQRWITPPCPD